MAFKSAEPLKKKTNLIVENFVVVEIINLTLRMKIVYPVEVVKLTDVHYV